MFRDYFKFETLGDDFSSIGQSIRSGQSSAVFGVTFAEKCLIAAMLDAPVLYLVKDPLYGMKAADEMKAICGEDVVFLPAKDDVLLYKNAFDKSSLYRRIDALCRIKRGARKVVATFESLLQLFPKDLPSVTVEKGGNYDSYDLAEFLSSAGYKREEFAESKGTFAMRGDIFEVFPVDSDEGYRIDFFGDEAEAIRKYDPADKSEKTAVSSVTIVPATDVLIRREDVPLLKERIETSLKKFRTLIVRDEAKKIAAELEEKLDAGNFDDSLQFLMPVVPSVGGDIFSYLSEDAVVCYDECKLLRDNLSAVVKEHTERCLSLSRAGKAFDFTVLQQSDGEKLIAKFNARRQIAFQNITTAIGFFNPLRTFSIRCSPVARYSVKPDDLFTDVSNWKFGAYKVLIACGNERRAEKLCEDMASRGITVTRSDTAELYPGSVVVTSYFLPTGIVLHGPKTVVIGTGDIYLERRADKKIRKRRNDLFQAPEVGDFAVHEVHGIGYVSGVKRISTQEGTKDYVAVQYLGGDVLYVGVDQLDKLTKYVGGGEKPTLNRIGGKEFERIKERARASIAEMTINLKELYKARKEKKGFVFSPDNELTEEFDNCFEFEPTEDQLQSVAEIRADMESEKVMDRLLCGDVGFGKTEVAFRAVFKAVSDGKQAALVCPTTILCEQHYMSALKRFEGFGVRIAALNRFKTPAEQAKIAEGLKNGEIDFVIGTHRLFGKDIGFRDLGLLVLDEEQRFGVEHKEKLKLLKDNVDTLTMTATPIPRTLHMSLTGIRDISTITTPPKVRIPVQTYVTEESDALIRDAVSRELARGGQVLILYNRVETIYKFAENVRAILPEAKLIVCHGQMDKKELENNVFSFYREEYNVLVATTIIENGIDLPKANTLIVIDSDKLGLSTLYQLKGRVGRSNVMAHAYFTFNAEKVLAESAYKRLSALMEFTDMGSGYKIAMRDLEIRGAGNVLGREQHGHMDKIGYELYSKLLKESLGEVTKDFDTELDIRTDAYIPDAYISNSSSRMDCYKQIAEIADEKDERRVLSSVEENYGPIPHEVENLVAIAKLKAAAKKKKVIKAVVSGKNASLTFAGIDALQGSGILDAVEKFKAFATLTFAENPVVVFRTDGVSPEETIGRMTAFLSSEPAAGK